MILETIRSIADTLASGSTGTSGSDVNTLLASMSIDAGDARPASCSAFTDETRTDEVASGRYVETFPNLSVTLDGSVKLNGLMYSDVRDAEVSIAIRYIQSGQLDASKGKTDCYYTLRAVEQALGDYLKPENLSHRVRNGVQIVESLSLEHVNLFEPIGDGICTGALKVVLKVRDTMPVTY